MATILRGSEPAASQHGVGGRLVLQRLAGAGDGPDAAAPEELQKIAADTLRRCSANAKDLRDLDMSFTVFAPLFISELGSALCHNTQLREVHLRNCGLDDHKVRVLAQALTPNEGGNRALEVLSLEDNDIGCKGAAQLAKLLDSGSRWSRTFGGYRTPGAGVSRGLTWLSLRNNKVADVGAKAIAEVLTQSNDRLQLLDLEGNRCTDWAAGWFALVLRNNNVLKHLNLCENPIGGDGAHELQAACESARASLLELPRGSRELEDANTLVDGQRAASVYISRPDEPHGDSLGSASCASTGFKRTLASRRTALGLQRQNRELGIDEPGSVMVNSIASLPPSARSRSQSIKGPSGSRRSSSSCRLSSQPPADVASREQRASSHRASGSSARTSRIKYRSTEVCARSSARAAAQRCAERPPWPQRPQSAKLGGRAPAPSTYPVSHVRVPGLLEQKSAQSSSGGFERAVGAEEKEAAVALAQPSRWQRKQRGSMPEGLQVSACRPPWLAPHHSKCSTDSFSSVRSCGSAAKLRRPTSAPARRN